MYDAQDEYLQVVTRNFTTHHPLTHVLLLGGMVQLVYKLTGSYNLGIACYTLLQMGVMSLVFAWCVEKMKTRGLGKWGRVLLTLYFGFCPVLVMFSLCSAKDGLFTGGMLVTVVLFQELWGQPDHFFRKKGNVFLLVSASAGMMLLRNNGFYAYLVFALGGIVKLWRARRKAAGGRGMPVLCLALPVAVYLLINHALAGILQADRSEHQEMLTVPISQMARVYREGEEGISPEDKERIRSKMEEAGILNMSAYVRKMALDGICVKLDLADVRQLIVLLQRCSTNLNQYAKRANETGSVYAADIEDLRSRLDEIWELSRQSLAHLANIR